ncbi:MAG: hypothetical protein NTW38_02345 [Candidatus Aminicenantes bacterium]|nr:hypothetical protein [Candidatus Aminicenantes bacterium]
MFSTDDDAPNDPRHFRRSLVPLDIEDAEASPSFGRRLARFFHRKSDPAMEDRFLGGIEPRPLPAARKENGAPPDDAFPDSPDPKIGDSDQNL